MTSALTTAKPSQHPDNDTAPETQEVLNRLYAAMPAAKKVQIVVGLQRTAQKLSGAGLKQREPAADVRQVALHWRNTTLPVDLAAKLSETTAMNEPLDAWDEVRRIARVLEKLDIRFAVGGSLASSIHGVPRFTNDADLCVTPFPAKEDSFVAELGDEYYASLPAIREAVARRKSFNIVRLASSFKIDFFVQAGMEFDQLVISRARPIDEPGSQVRPPIMSAEDVLLHKLEWYRLGNEISDRQWKDILGILRTQGDALDREYVLKWSENLRVTDLAVRAFKEA